MLMGEKRAGCFAWFVILVFCDCYVALPHSAVNWSAVFDCVITWSYSHTRFFLAPVHLILRKILQVRKIGAH